MSLVCFGKGPAAEGRHARMSNPFTTVALLARHGAGAHDNLKQAGINRFDGHL
jgi:hypothetical protein